MNTGDRNLRLAVLKAFVDVLNDALAAERADHLALLADRYDDEGQKSFDVRLPASAGGERVKVATVSLTVPKDAVDVNDPQLQEWATANAPDLLRHVPEQPPVAAVPAHDELDPKRVTELLARVKPTAEGMVDTTTGLVVDGLTHVPAGRPRSFSVRYADDGRGDVLRAWRAGSLEAVLAGTPLPQIDAPTVTRLADEEQA